MKKKFGVQLLLVLILAILLECTIFQLPYYSLKWKGAALNQVYTLEQFEPHQWTKEGGQWVSQRGQQLVLDSLSTQVETLTLETKIAPLPDYILIFYTEEPQEEFSDQKSILYTGEPVKLGTQVERLRIDLSNQPEYVLESLTLTLNAGAFSFSMARLVTMLLLVVFGKLLFWLQKPMTYQIDK